MQLREDADLRIAGKFMSFVHELRRLRAEHADILRLARALLGLLGAPTAPPSAVIEPIREQLRGTLRRHLKCEDWALYPRLRATGEAAAADLAREFAGTMGHVADDCDDYERRWPPPRVAAQWDQFCVESTAILGAITARIEREDRELYPVLDQLAGAALPASR
ncbi:hemerythrin domain-containing protein [Sphingopyxis flava]|uniref:Hemerythrin HHE cation binding domain-containing protein n=1 Tax=Sphingopyxis flava TaxID=1507287 RepID=A0A1T5BYH6_9SPHN|nr:hemerythrin domain-containing protein [Sphingopyxis flava]SKB52398.1 Hemerythrin HHE cation binding domain-containing protein [Sphingopyxis flava]